MVEANYKVIYRAGLNAGLEPKKAKEVAERAVGVPDRCTHQGVEGDQCTRMRGHGGFHEWSPLGFEFGSVLVAVS